MLNVWNKADGDKLCFPAVHCRWISAPMVTGFAFLLCCADGQVL